MVQTDVTHWCLEGIKDNLDLHLSTLSSSSSSTAFPINQPQLHKTIMLFNKLVHFVLVLVLALVSVASAQTTKRLTIHPKVRFCLLLPRWTGISITTGIPQSVTWCTSSTSVVRYARIFPTGFIKTAYYLEGPNGRYTQVTGRIDRTKFGLSSSDDGAQSVPGSPTGSSCVGFNYFVQFVEPNENIYCLRCCYFKDDCPSNQGDKGCRAVISNGNYS